jgi:hypothetical protein
MFNGQLDPATPNKRRNVSVWELQLLKRTSIMPECLLVGKTDLAPGVGESAREPGSRIARDVKEKIYRYEIHLFNI